MKRFKIFLVFVLFGILGCQEEKIEDTNTQDGATIATIYEQIIAINSSINSLNGMDKALNDYIKSLNATASDLQAQIADVNEDISRIESELGGEISSIKQDLLNELNATKIFVEDKLNAINKTISDLEVIASGLDDRIASLQAYIESELASTANWASATFSTLEQYEQTQTELSTIKSMIELINTDIVSLENNIEVKLTENIQTAINALRTEMNADYASRIESAINDITIAYTVAVSSAKSEITTAYTKAISEAIKVSEDGMKEWVNTLLLQSYYDIATVDGKLSALASRLDEKDSAMQEQIAEQVLALETAKTELSEAYKSAISEAIQINSGVINENIANAIQKLQKEINEQLNRINNQISYIENTLNNFIDEVRNTIQSLIYIPEYSDGKVKMNIDDKSLSLDFLISPSRMATVIESSWKSNLNTVSAYIMYTKDASTRAIGREVPMKIVDVVGDSNGVLSIEMTEDVAHPLDEDFLNGKKDAVLFLRIINENTEICSSPISIDNFQEGCRVSIENVTATTAAFVGNVDVMEEDLGLTKVSIYYSNSDVFSIYDESTSHIDVYSFDSNGYFTKTLSNLKYNTHYNYCIVTTVRGKVFYSDVMSFTTNDVSLNASHSSIMGTSADIYCYFDGLVNVDLESVEVGYIYSTSSISVSNGAGTKIPINYINDNGSVSKKLTGLLPATWYYYCLYLLQDGVYVYSKVGEFRTVAI